MELHVVFGYSAAGSIRHILKGREAAVARFSDNLSCGPINPPQPAIRRAWLDANLGYDNPDITSDEDTFWPEVLQKDVKRIAWASRRSASEYCNYLEYLKRLDGLPTEIIDTTDVRDEGGELFRGTGVIPGNHILSGLLNTGRQLDAPSRTDCLALWESLRTDNSDLRIVDQNLGLLSVPLSFYDQQLLALVNRDWQRMERIVGEMLADGVENDLLLFSRLYALLDVGALVERDSGKPHPDVKLAGS